VEKVDENLKADIMHWAAIYVRSERSCYALVLIIADRRIACGWGTRRFST
jgi:hypothetical protein